MLEPRDDLNSFARGDNLDIAEAFCIKVLTPKPRGISVLGSTKLAASADTDGLTPDIRNLIGTAEAKFQISLDRF